MRVPAIDRAVQILRVLTESERPPRLAEVVRRTGLPRSSVHDLLGSLLASGLVERGRSSTYTLGLLLVELAGARLAGSDLVSEFVHACDRDERLGGRTLVLGILQGSDVLYIAIRFGGTGLAINYHIGKRLPANCTATGKAILATLVPERLDEMLSPGEELSSLTSGSISDRDRLMEDLRTVAARGYAIDDEETAIGMWCVGAPIFSRSGDEAVAAVATSMVKAGIDNIERDRIVDGVAALANEISARLGAPPDRAVVGPGRTGSVQHRVSTSAPRRPDRSGAK